MKYTLLIFLLMPFYAVAVQLDTTKVLKQLAEDLKQIKNLSYEYTMEAKFPNGDKDHMQGTIYLDTDDRLYYNSCSAFTLIYSAQWYYRADHKSKTLTVIDVNKEDKKLNKARDKEIFQNGALTNFLDSVLLKTATIKKFALEGDIRKITLSFPAAANIKTMELAYNPVLGLMISCSTTTSQPWQKTPQGIQTVDMKISFGNFKKVTDKSMYTEQAFFTYKNRKLELKKYENYKLIKKI